MMVEAGSAEMFYLFMNLSNCHKKHKAGSMEETSKKTQNKPTHG